MLVVPRTFVRWNLTVSVSNECKLYQVNLAFVHLVSLSDYFPFLQICTYVKVSVFGYIKAIKICRLDDQRCFLDVFAL